MTFPIPRQFVSVALLLLVRTTWAGSAMYPFVDEKALADAQTTKVLFIGNSFTYFWDMPGMVMKLAGSAEPARKLYAAHVTGGGMTLEDHFKGNKALEAIQKYPWDVIVLQKWREPKKEQDLETYVPLFAEAIHKALPKAKVLIYMTESVGMPFGTTRPAIPALDLPKIQAEYDAAAKKAGAIVVPASWAWMAALADRPPAEQWFYRSNDGHPSVRRQYLTACLMYACIFQTSPVGLPWRDIGKAQEKNNPFTAPTGKETLSEEDAKYMQTLAWEMATKHAGIKAE